MVSPCGVVHILAQAGQGINLIDDSPLVTPALPFLAHLM
jgi:hypothetical protein